MATEMIERLQGVIARHYYGDSIGELDAMSSETRRQFGVLAVKMLKAIRQPTAAMCDAAVDAEFPAGDLGADQVAAVAEGAWRAMIDAALAD